MKVEEKTEFTHKTGLHARSAAEFVKKAEKFNSKIFIISNGKEINAKSIMGVMGLGINQNDEINIKAIGDDSQEAVDSLVSFIGNI